MPADNFFKYLLLKTRRFCGFICGFVFFLSGILKLMDPVGAGLVMDSYLDFLHIGFLGFASKPLAFLFALAETIVGTAMITGVWRRITAIIALSLQGFFTLLTILLAIFNPVMDCGCFGEFIHLTHVETLVKNLVICALLSYAYFPMRNLGRPLKRKYVSFGVVCTSVLIFSIFSLSRLPIIDFTDYEPGAQILSADANVADEAFDAMFIYEKDGVQQEFTLENLPDSTWTFVSTQTIQNKDLKSSGATLSFYDNDKEYQDSLAVQGNVMVISIYDPQMRQKKWDAAVRMAENARESGFNPMILIAGTPEQIKGEFPLASEFAKIKEVRDRLGVVGAGTACNNNRIGFTALFGQKRNVCQIQHVDDVGIAHFIADGKGDHIKILYRILTLQRPKR